MCQCNGSPGIKKKTCELNLVAVEQLLIVQKVGQECAPADLGKFSHFAQ